MNAVSAASARGSGWRVMIDGRQRSPLGSTLRPAAPLLADAKSLNNVFVALGVVFLEVVQQAAPLAHHHEKTAPGRVVLLVGVEVLRQLPYPLAQNRNLHFRTAGVAGMCA